MGTSRTALITGASSGIGRATALHLNDAGYRVIGTVRHQEDGAALVAGAAQPDMLIPVRCDVTNEHDVQAQAARVGEITGGVLDAMFSNAGIANMRGDVTAEGCPVATLDRMMQVNYLGAVRAIQAHLPMLRAARGTLVMNSALMACAWCASAPPPSERRWKPSRTPHPFPRTAPTPSSGPSCGEGLR